MTGGGCEPVPDARVIRVGGLGLTLVQAGMGWLLPFQWGLLGHPRRDEPYSGPEHLRMAFEDLGPTFIKLAQILSTRGDLIGPEYAAELARLQSAVPPIVFPDMARVLDVEFPVPRTDVFATFDTEPIGSGSIGQAYRATLHSGEAVVVKIQKPGVHTTVEMDLAILHRWIRRRTSRDSSATFYDIAGFFEEFAFTLVNELDYTNEGDNADRIRGIHRDHTGVFIPTIYWDYSTPRVLVMDEIRGPDFADAVLETLLTPDDRHRLAAVALQVACVIAVELRDYEIKPDPILVESGSVVSFQIVNNGSVQHEFRLTSDLELEEHLVLDGAPDASIDHTEDDSVVVVLLDPGEMRAIDVAFPSDVNTFTVAACLIRGHYECGMWATIAYQSAQ